MDYEITEEEKAYNFLIDTQQKALEIIEQWVIDYVPKSQLNDPDDLLFDRWEAREKLKNSV